MSGGGPTKKKKTEISESARKNEGHREQCGLGHRPGPGCKGNLTKKDTGLTYEPIQPSPKGKIRTQRDKKEKRRPTMKKEKGKIFMEPKRKSGRTL